MWNYQKTTTTNSTTIKNKIRQSQTQQKKLASTLILTKMYRPSGKKNFRRTAPNTVTPP